MCLLVAVTRSSSSRFTSARANSSSANSAYAGPASPSRGQTCCATANRRGMRAPVLAVGDGAPGVWKALRAVFPTTREQRCWFQVPAKVLAALPKSAHPGAKAALAEIFNAEDKEHALKAAKASEADYGAKWPRAAAKITDHLDVLLAFTTTPPSTGSTCAKS